jgi:predicted enzyme related to lactoylglutathione lyase
MNLNSLLIGTRQPEALVKFYEQVLGKPADVTDQDQGFWMWQLESMTLGVLDHSAMLGKTKDPGRVMFNFETSRVKQDFERLKGLGAEVVREPYELQGGWVATLADPDGNYFQLMTPFEDMPGDSMK